MNSNNNNNNKPFSKDIDKMVYTKDCCSSYNFLANLVSLQQLKGVARKFQSKIFDLKSFITLALGSSSL